MKKYAVLVAGGSGTRMKSSVPKQFMLLNGTPVICHTIAVFTSAFPDLQIILVLPQIYMEEGRKLIESYFPGLTNIAIVAGGETRFHSVKNGLSAVHKDSIVFVHDAVRCLLTADLIHRLYEATLQKGNAVPMVLSKDSVRIIDENGNKAIDRNKLALIQTPQVFKGEMLIDAFNADYRDGFTDEASVVEAAGFLINLIQGEENNLKLTQPIDWVVAEKILAQTGSQ